MMLRMSWSLMRSCRAASFMRASLTSSPGVLSRCLRLARATCSGERPQARANAAGPSLNTAEKQIKQETVQEKEVVGARRQPMGLLLQFIEFHCIELDAAGARFARPEKMAIENGVARTPLLQRIGGECDVGQVQRLFANMVETVDLLGAHEADVADGQDFFTILQRMPALAARDPEQLGIIVGMPTRSHVASKEKTRHEKAAFIFEIVLQFQFLKGAVHGENIM